MNPNEIKKALEYYGEEIPLCIGCNRKKNLAFDCIMQTCKNALAYINQLEAKVERYKDNLNAVLEERADENIESEAIKEFAEKFNRVIDIHLERYSVTEFSEFKAICQVLRGLKNDVYNLVKEMVSDDNGT